LHIFCFSFVCKFLFFVVMPLEQSKRPLMRSRLLMHLQ
jgi:hypothetical protein